MSSVLSATKLEALGLAALADRALAELRTGGDVCAATREALLLWTRAHSTSSDEGPVLRSDQDDTGKTPGSGLPYVRRTLMAGSAGELMLATWAPHLRCAPHDHGGSSGLVLIVVGRFDERSFTFDGRRLIEGPHVQRPPGSAIRVSPTTIHDMESLDPDGLTLHLYAPAPQPMRLYDSEHRVTVVVGEGHGAWLPAHRPLEVSSWSA